MFVERKDVVGFRLAPLHTGEPAGMPGTARPNTGGFSFKRR
jgi:hypothetical protein